MQSHSKKKVLTVHTSYPQPGNTMTEPPPVANVRPPPARPTLSEGSMRTVFRASTPMPTRPDHFFHSPPPRSRCCCCCAFHAKPPITVMC
jgi:hypothetical protein